MELSLELDLVFSEGMLRGLKCAGGESVPITFLKRAALRPYQDKQEPKRHDRMQKWQSLFKEYSDKREKNKEYTGIISNLTDLDSSGVQTEVTQGCCNKVKDSFTQVAVECIFLNAF